MNLALLISSIIASILGQNPNVPSGIKQIIMDIYNSFSALVKSGVVQQPTAVSVMAALLGILQALQADPKLPKNELAIVGSLITAIQAALKNDPQTQIVIDPSTILPIEPVA